VARGPPGWARFIIQPILRCCRRCLARTDRQTFPMRTLPGPSPGVQPLRPWPALLRQWLRKHHRRSRQREAGERYQQSRVGRHKHATRMHQWRKRRSAAAKIVTYHGSRVPHGRDVLAANESPPAISPDSQAQSPCSPIAPDSIALCAPANTRISMPAPLLSCH
jgi:hypothetical protein